MPEHLLDVGGDGGASGCALASAAPWPEADALFQKDPIWIGSDAGFQSLGARVMFVSSPDAD